MPSSVSSETLTRFADSSASGSLGALPLLPSFPSTDTTTGHPTTITCGADDGGGLTAKQRTPRSASSVESSDSRRVPAEGISSRCFSAGMCRCTSIVRFR